MVANLFGVLGGRGRAFSWWLERALAATHTLRPCSQTAFTRGPVVVEAAPTQPHCRLHNPRPA